MIWYLLLYDLSLDIWERTFEMIFWHFDGLLWQITKELIKKDLCPHKKVVHPLDVREDEDENEDDEKSCVKRNGSQQGLTSSLSEPPIRS